MIPLLKYFLIPFLVPIFGYSQIVEYKRIDNPESIYSNISARSAKLKSLKCEFKQIKYISSLSVTFESHGNFYLKEKNSFKWEYIEPYNYSIIIKEEEVFVNDNGQNTDFNSKKSQVFNSINSIIKSINSGDLESIDKDFSESVTVNKEYYCISLKPMKNQATQIISEIVIYFDRNNFSIDNIKAVEKSGDHTVIEFFNPSVNCGISDSVFSN